MDLKELVTHIGDSFVHPTLIQNVLDLSGMQTMHASAIVSSLSRAIPLTKSHMLGCIISKQMVTLT